MRFPRLKPAAQRRVLIDSFRGYEHNAVVSPGAFYDMKNLTGSPTPLISVRRRRILIPSLDGNPATAVNTLGGRGSVALLDNYGTLWCGGHALPRLLDGTPGLQALDGNGQSVTIADPQAVYGILTTPGLYSFLYDGNAVKWIGQEGQGDLAGSVFTPAQAVDGMQIDVTYSYALTRNTLRELVFMGTWVCIFPDGKYANTALLRTGSEMTPCVDYGAIDQSNYCDQGGTVFEPCGADGTPWTVTWADTAPADGYWVDTTEAAPRVRHWDQSLRLWQEVSPYVKCSVPGIALGLRAGDSVTLTGQFDSSQGGESEVEALWCGDRVLTEVWHDPGAANRDEGTGDYLVFPGLLSQRWEIEMTWHDRSWLNAKRPFPTMDFVVEAGNRLWGCRFGDGVNELYGSKLGDFRCWYAFEGLSTDSYRVARGHDGPYTGAAVLGGCPLFFREDSLEKLLPSAAGNHSVVTVSLEGMEQGSAKSAVVIRDRLYYKGPKGVYYYNGTLPVRVSQALGDVPYHWAVAGALGSRYYISMTEPSGSPCLFALDTETGFWYKEDLLRFRAAHCFDGLLYYSTELGGALYCIGSAEDSQDVPWFAETGKLFPRMAPRRYVTRMQVKARLDPNASMTVSISYDGGSWLQKGQITGSGAHSVTFSVFTRRADNVRIRLAGTGGMELQSLSWLTEMGSDV